MSVRCFMVRPVELEEAWLRRWSREECPQGRLGHHAAVHIGRVPIVYKDDDDGRPYIASTPVEDYAGDPRWPTSCACGYEFEETDERHVLGRQLWEADGGERRIIAAVGSDDSVPVWGPGAMWDAWWMRHRRSPDGRYLVVKLPNGHDWTIDSRSSNCTRPGEDHDCWCRHGEPPNITVDKRPEPGRSTCQAGGGSVASGTPGKDYWHGFLRDGVLVVA